MNVAQPIPARHLAASLLLATSFLLAGCKPDAALRRGEVIDKSTGPGQAATPPANTPGPAADSTQFGSIKGIISFAGKPPARVKIDMSMDPACAMSGADNMSEPIVVANGRLGNVYLYIKSGITPSSAPAVTPPVVLDQHGCKYIPHVIAIQQGGTVEFRNSDPTMHNIHAVPAANGNQQVDVSQGPLGQPQVRQFNAPEVMMPIRCNNHPWMNAYLNVADSPYFAVSSASGDYTIRGLPPGTYTLAAVHEKLGEQDTQITVPAKGTITANFTYSAK